MLPGRECDIVVIVFVECGVQPKFSNVAASDCALPNNNAFLLLIASVGIGDEIPSNPLFSLNGVTKGSSSFCISGLALRLKIRAKKLFLRFYLLSIPQVVAPSLFRPVPLALGISTGNRMVGLFFQG